MPKYVEPNEGGLFDKAARLEELHGMGDPLARLDQVIDWTLFEPVFARIPRVEPRGPGGRPPYRPLMMFKALVIQNLYQLSDAQLEFQITDRLSFKCFLGLSDADKSPDEKTFWAFRETLTGNQLIGPLFDLFDSALQSQGMFARKGQMVDATFVEVPRQRNSREDHARIKAGEAPASWQGQPEKARQKDTDARWTSKNGQRHYGYKNHVKVDSRSKLIEDFTVTPASVHDSQALGALIAPGDPTTYVDSGYAGAGCEAVFAACKVEAKPIGRAYRNRPLNGRQKRANRARSRIRVRVEHVFATMRMCMRAAWNRCIGLARNQAAIAMTNLVYNMVRLEQIARLGLKNWRAA